MTRTNKVLLILAASGLLVSTLMPPVINRMRTRQGLVQEVMLETAHPGMQFITLALGGFRGIIADLLWFRVSTLQQDKRFFEIVQLADWITRLEPRLASVWVFHAWNMSYNISVYFDRPEDRWRWVMHGIRLLRDEGIRLNPDQPQLYRELGWIFQHKLGMNMDDSHLYYKVQLAQAFHPVEQERSSTGQLSTKSSELQQVLREWRLDPAYMLQLEQALGTLDWRLPETHAVYWSTRGLEHAQGHQEKALSRMLIQNLASLSLSGRLEFSPGQDLYRRAPDWNLLAPARRAFETAVSSFPGDTTFTDGARNYASTAAGMLRSDGMPDKAAELEAWASTLIESQGTVRRP